MSVVRTVIVDDEPLAQRRLLRLLQAHPEIEVVASAEDGHSAARVIAETRPDLLMVDILMPGLSGLELIGGLQDPPPAVIFVTAFSEYALQAFDLAATDYLLKPIEPERLATALARAHEALSRRTAAERIAELQDVLTQLRSARPQVRSPWAREVWILNRNERVSIPTEQIDLVRAERDYVRIFAGGVSHLRRETIDSLAKRLDPERFARVHRSTIVRLDRIERLRRERGRLILVLTTGAEAPVSRSRARAFRLQRDRPGSGDTSL